MFNIKHFPFNYLKLTLPICALESYHIFWSKTFLYLIETSLINDKCWVISCFYLIHINGEKCLILSLYLILRFYAKDSFLRKFYHAFSFPLILIRIHKYIAEILAAVIKPSSSSNYREYLSHKIEVLLSIQLKLYITLYTLTILQIISIHLNLKGYLCSNTITSHSLNFFLFHSKIMSCSGDIQVFVFLAIP